MKTNIHANGTLIANQKVPVMCRLLEFPASPQEQQTLGKSSRQRSGRPAERACESAVDPTTAHDLLGGQ
jgi:hypothetical protein